MDEERLAEDLEIQELRCSLHFDENPGFLVGPEFSDSYKEIPLEDLPIYYDDTFRMSGPLDEDIPVIRKKIEDVAKFIARLEAIKKELEDYISPLGKE